ncbi:MAG: deoxyribonuclease IV, partial [Deltaproteobacteria bacterium]|nr:deoxyribonuclease IV [Deltaproteobacteria bacterium]
MSIAGGLHLAFTRIRKVKGEALQIFLSNQRQWKTPPLTSEMIEDFSLQWQKNKQMVVAAHDSYLINLAAPDQIIAEKSVAAFADELQRAATLGIPFLITHPGSHRGVGVEGGLERFAANLDRAITQSKTSTVMVLIENTAGQGTNLGSTFEEIAFILNESEYGEGLGVCFDTSHAFAAGYDIRTRITYEDTFSKFDQIIGL